MGIPYAHAVRRLPAEPRVASSTTPGPTPSAPTASRRSRPSWRSATGRAWSASTRRPPTRTLLLAVHSREHVDAIARSSQRGGGTIDVDTVTSRGSWEAALHAAGGAARMVDLLVGERSYAAAFCGLRPPATTPSARGPWGSACSTTWRSRRGGRAMPTASSACSCWTGTSTTATGRTRSSTTTPGSCSSRSTSGRSTPEPGRRMTWAAGRGAASRSTFPCRRARATRLSRRTSSTSWARWCGTTGRASSSSRRATTPIATIRSRTAR